MAHRFICAMKTTMTGPVAIGQETAPLRVNISAVFDPDRRVDPDYNGKAALQGSDPSGAFYLLTKVEGQDGLTVQLNAGVWEGDIRFKVNKESQPGAVTAGIYAVDKATVPNVQGDTYPWVTIKIASDATPTMDAVTITTGGFPHTATVPKPYSITVEGKEVFKA